MGKTFWVAITVMTLMLTISKMADRYYKHVEYMAQCQEVRK